ncbi:MAG TPA: glycoside hydrolase family 31 protein, partial [Gaiellaceae bacterium]
MLRPRTTRGRLATGGALLVLAGGGAGGWVLVAHTGGGSDGRVTWKVDKAPFALHVLKGGHELLADATGAAGPGTRLSYTLTDGSNHTVTSLIGSRAVAGGTEYSVHTDEANRTSTVTVKRTSRSIHVSWRLQPDADVDTVYAAFHSPARSEHFVGAGINHTGVDLNGQLVQLKVAYSCARSVVTPFFASSAGYGVYFDTGAVGHMQFRGTHDGMACNDSNSANPLCTVVPGPDRVQACFKTPSLDYDVFVGPPANVVAKYRATAGLMPMPAPAEFATIKWRDRVKGAGDVTDDIAQFRRLGIPLGSVLVDNPWETNGCWGALQFDPRFGNPAALIRAVHRAGVRFMVWVSPWVTPSAACKSLSTFGTGTTLLTPQGWDAVDFTNPSARTTYEAKIAALVRLGVDGFKGDRGDETDLESLQFAGGPGRAVNNLFPELFARSVLRGARAAGNASPVTMFRAAYTGTPAAGAGVWSGDQIPDFAGMQDAIHSLASLGASGFALTGSDVGGYATQTGQQILTPEVFARWTQLGAISPIFEVGGADRAAQFWKLGPAAIAAARNSILLHYELFPYLYSLARASSRTGSPILQPLGLQYPEDEQAWRSDLELLVGRDLLAAPVTSSTQAARVYLPAGSWVDLFRGDTQQGGRTVTRPTPLSEFPLYLRAGATIPFDFRRASLWTRPWPLDALSVRGRAGWLSAAADVTLTGAPRETEMLLSRQSPPTHVSVDGQEVPRFPNVAALRAARTGWVWNASPFPG